MEQDENSSLPNLMQVGCEKNNTLARCTFIHSIG